MSENLNDVELNDKQKSFVRDYIDALNESLETSLDVYETIAKTDNITNYHDPIQFNKDLNKTLSQDYEAFEDIEESEKDIEGVSDEVEEPKYETLPEIKDQEESIEEEREIPNYTDFPIDEYASMVKELWFSIKKLTNPEDEDEFITNYRKARKLTPVVMQNADAAYEALGDELYEVLGTYLKEADKSEEEKGFFGRMADTFKEGFARRSDQIAEYGHVMDSVIGSEEAKD